MILSIQYLRGLAALMVVVFHAGEALVRLTGEPSALLLEVGLSGVDIFFVISGFIIYRTTAGRTVDPLDFAWKRIVRIVPLYWLLTLLVANVAILRPDLVSTAVYDGPHLLASLFFVPVQHPAFDETLPLLIPGWTLNYEMAFYGLFALALFLPERARVPAVMGVLVAAVAVREVIPYRDVTAFYTMPLILEFGAGMMIGVAWRAGLEVRAGLAAAVFAIALAALVAMAGSGLWRSVACGIPAAMIVAGALFYERARGLPQWTAMRLLGDASYSIYLTHVLVLPVLAKLWSLGEVPSDPAWNAAFLAAAILASVVAGVATHLLLERPLLVVLRGSGVRRTASAEPALHPARGRHPERPAALRGPRHVRA